MDENSYAEYSTLICTIKPLKEANTTRCKFVNVYLGTIRLKNSPRRFLETQKKRVQLGFLILIVDKRGASNIIRYDTDVCKSFSKYGFAAEIHYLNLGY